MVKGLFSLAFALGAMTIAQAEFHTIVFFNE